MRTRHRYTIPVVLSAISASAALVGGGAGSAAAAPEDTSLGVCFASYNTPVIPIGTGAASSIRSNGTTSTVTIQADARSLVPYQQTATITWANLDTGKSGSGEASKSIVGGSNNYYSVTGLPTGKGRISVTMSLSNSLWFSTTTGQCQSEVYLG